MKMMAKTRPFRLESGDHLPFKSDPIRSQKSDVNEVPRLPAARHLVVVVYLAHHNAVHREVELFTVSLAVGDHRQVAKLGLPPCTLMIIRLRKRIITIIARIMIDRKTTRQVISMMRLITRHDTAAQVTVVIGITHPVSIIITTIIETGSDLHLHSMIAHLARRTDHAVTIIAVGIGDRTLSAGIVDPPADAVPHRFADRAVVVEAVRHAHATKIVEEELSVRRTTQIRRKLTTTHCS